MERMTAYVASHPVSADRAKRFRTAAAGGSIAYMPAHEPAQWQALRSICRGSRDRMTWRF